MKGKYTPGPWLSGKFGYRGWNFEGGFNGAILNGEGKTIFAGPASFQALRGDTEEQAEANAKLIAAAPELLEVLILTLPYIEMAEFDESYKKGAVKKILNQIEAVIKKATE